jgi:hypothetical protein
VKTRIAWLWIATLGLWIVAAYPAGWLWGRETHVQSLAAMAPCLMLATLTLAAGRLTLVHAPRQLLVVLLAGMGLQMALTLGVAGLMYALIPALKGAAFWIWLLIFFEVTLALEMALILVGRPVAATEQPS